MNFLYRFMQGRRGTDQLNFALVVLAIIFTLISSIVGFFAMGTALTVVYTVFQFLGMVFLVLSVLRMFSRNIPARECENAAFMRVLNRIRAPFRRSVRNARDHDHAYLKCPSCGAELRVPKGKGSIVVTCPKCRHEIKTKT